MAGFGCVKRNPIVVFGWRLHGMQVEWVTEEIGECEGRRDCGQVVAVSN